MKKIMAVFLFLFALSVHAHSEDMPLFADITGYMRYGENVDVNLSAGAKDGVTGGMEGTVLDGSEEIGKVTVLSISDNTCKATLKIFSPARTMSSGYRIKFMVKKVMKTEDAKSDSTSAFIMPSVSTELKTLSDENQKLKIEVENLKKAVEEIKNTPFAGTDIKETSVPAAPSPEKCVKPMERNKISI